MTVVALPGRPPRDDDGERLLRELLAGLPLPVWLVAPQTLRVLTANDAAATLLDRPAERLAGTPAADLIPAAEDAFFWGQPPQPGDMLDSSVLWTDADGRPRTLHRTVRHIDLAGRPVWMVSAIDESELRRVEDEREALLADLQATLESTGDGLLVIDTECRVRAFNRRFVQMWALPDALLHRREALPLLDWMQSQIIEPADDARVQSALRLAALSRSSDRIVLRDGRVFDRTSLPQLRRGVPIGRVYSFRDETERVRTDRRIRELTFTDALTGLPNRGYLDARLPPTIALADREARHFALMLLDLDHFKQINDSLGHEAGDGILREVAMRLKACLREGDLIARVGGDQFALLLHHTDTPGSEAGARRLLETVSQPFTVESSQFTVTCSIGVALYPRDGRSGDELMRASESAMRAAKGGGRSDFRFPRGDVPVIDLRSRIRLDHAMRQALVSKRFRLHYQPQVDLATGEVVGAEALIRWRDPERGEISPAEFIPVAEDTGFIIAIGDWVLGQAVRQAAAWHRLGWRRAVAVNVSALQFQQDGFVDRVDSVLKAAGLPPSMLELELTESILVRDAQEALARLNALAALGVQLAIDDFGTGYSSLAYLKRFPIGKLKIDRSFIRGLPADETDVGIVNAVVQMARALGLDVVAEGVETEAQRRFLADTGCAQFQGWLYAPALGVLEFEQRLGLGR